MDYAIAHNAKIINMSFAGPQDPALAQELQIAREKGILIVAAAGNAGRNHRRLSGRRSERLAVTATDVHDPCSPAPTRATMSPSPRPA